MLAFFKRGKKIGKRFQVSTLRAGQNKAVLKPSVVESAEPSSTEFQSLEDSA